MHPVQKSPLARFLGEVSSGIGAAFGRRYLCNAHPNEALFVEQVRRPIMDREHVKGAADKAKGAIKDTAGKVTGDKELQTEGKMDTAKGSAHNLAGDVKDAVRKARE
jgi:uncharacterized protein YjbJ (UPF0337 family)